MVEKSTGTGFWPMMYEPFRTFGTRLADWFSPLTEASSDDGSYRISMELPGLVEDDIHLSVEDGVVSVSGEKKTTREDKGETWYFSERQFGSFSRSFRLPADADEAGVKADMKDGVLTVTVPKKSPQKVASKRVPINRA
jgi:HSP20 family protein